MKTKKQIGKVAINSVVRFPRQSYMYKVVTKCNGLVWLEKVERNPQISFVPEECDVYVVEGF